MSRCGLKYHVGTETPKNAKYAVYFWGYVIFHTKKTAAENTKSRLPYYEQEDARIEKLR